MSLQSVLHFSCRLVSALAGRGGSAYFSFWQYPLHAWESRGWNFCSNNFQCSRSETRTFNWWGGWGGGGYSFNNFKIIIVAVVGSTTVRYCNNTSYLLVINRFVVLLIQSRIRHGHQQSRIRHEHQQCYRFMVRRAFCKQRVLLQARRVSEEM